MARRKQPSTWYDLLHQVAPPLLMVFFTSTPLLLALVGRGETPTWSGVVDKVLGSVFGWGCVAVFWLWAALWLLVPSKQYEGPVTSFGYRPKYQDNGVLYNWVSIMALLVAQALYPGLSTYVYTNMPEILASSNIAALVFCSLLWIKGKMFPDHLGDKVEAKSFVYEFYRGIELHPRVLGMDVKQFSISRVGMMGWQILVIIFFIAGVEKHGVSAATIVSLSLQTVYIAKFFWCEVLYFHTLDFVYDRAGYYLCWGCLVWVPCLYTYASYYFVKHLPLLSTSNAVLTGLFGLVTILTNFRADYEKYVFRSYPQWKLWGKPPRFMVATYRDVNGQLKESRLLLSGCWGLARHLNYTFELMATLAWCLPGIGLSILPFSYFIFLTALLVHRMFRVEQKCAIKYGKDWEKYCQQVRYKLIPYVF